MIKSYSTLDQLSSALLLNEHNPIYWATLFHNSKIVITAVAMSDQKTVAPKLGMSQSKLSQITVILREYAQRADNAQRAENV